MSRALPSVWQVLVLGLVATLAPVVLGCGGGESAPDEHGEVERHYLRDVCAAGALFDTASGEMLRLQQVGADAPEDNAMERLVLTNEVLEEVVAALRGATPPSGVEEYHAAMLAQYEELSEAVLAATEGGEEAVADVFEGPGALAGALQLPPLAPETWERLASAARDVPECSGATSLLGFLGTGEAALDGEVSPADEEYVRDVCLAGSAYQDALVSALGDGGVDLSDPEELIEALGEPVAVVAAALNEISPPEGLEEHHTATLAYFAYVARALGVADARVEVSEQDMARVMRVMLAEDGSVMRSVMPPTPSPDVRDRIVQAANGVVECYGSGLFLLGFLGGGG